MNRKIIIFLLFLLWALPLQAEEKFSLKRCYELALKHSETVAISQEEIIQAKTHFTQALGTILPQININATEFLQDDSAQGSTQNITGNIDRTFTRFSRPQVAVNVYQNLFQGLKEIAALKMSGADQRQQRFKKEDVERLLYKDVATAFYTIAEAEINVDTTQKAIRILADRTDDLKERVKLGKNRESELLAQQADLKLLEANLEGEIGTKKVAYEMMSFLTGLDPQPPIQLGNPTAKNVQSVESFLKLVDQRPDVLASRQAIDVAKGNVVIQRAGLIPNANAQFNYYPYRVGFQKDIHWDATFNMTIPVFSWGTFGYIKEAKSKAKQAELQSEEIRRVAIKEIKQAYDNYQTSLIQLKKYNIAEQKAETAYRKQAEDFSLGLLTNLDVLQSERTWLDATRQRNDIKLKVFANEIALEITAGIDPLRSPSPESRISMGLETAPSRGEKP